MANGASANWKFVTAADTELEQLPDRTHYWYSKPGLTHTQDLLCVRVRMTPGQCHEFHYHPKMEEILYILSGEAEQWVDREKRLLAAGDSVHIPAGWVHGTYNSSGANLEFLAILTPASSGDPALVDVSQEEPWKSLRG